MKKTILLFTAIFLLMSPCVFANTIDNIDNTVNLDITKNIDSDEKKTEENIDSDEKN